MTKNIKLINFGGMNSWDNLIKIELFYVISILLCYSCSSNSDKNFVLRIDTWQYEKGGQLISVTDTVKKGIDRFDNPYMNSIIYLDSINNMVELDNINNDTIIYMKDYEIKKTETINFDSLNKGIYKAYIHDKNKDKKYAYFYLNNVGVIAYYVYGHGLIRLKSRISNSSEVNIDSMIFQKIYTSEKFIPDGLPDSVKVYDLLE